MLFEDLCSIDLITPIERAIATGHMPPPNTEGKIQLENAWDPERNWVDVCYDPNRRCDLWLDVIFRYYRIVPRGCRSCWKVTVRPKTLKQLMDVSEIQHKRNINAKSGIEKRDYTGNKGGYAAFWYAPLDGGLKGGRELYDLVKKDLKDTGLEPSLKRGCTEMEMAYNPSSKWDEIAKNNGWDAREDILNDFFIKGKRVEEPILVYKTHSLISWMKYAKAHGDPTIVEFMEEHNLVRPVEHYHQSGNHSAINFESSWGNNGKNNNRPDDAEDEKKNSGSKHGEKEGGKISLL